MENASEKEAQLRSTTSHPVSSRSPVAKDHTGQVVQAKGQRFHKDRYESYMADWGLIPAFG